MKMTANDLYSQLKLVCPALAATVEKYKSMKDNDRSIFVTTTSGKEFIFTYLFPGVWCIESVKYYKKEAKK
jgi:hypothetical protein